MWRPWRLTISLQLSYAESAGNLHLLLRTVEGLVPAF
jgi:hypothetical protein